MHRRKKKKSQKNRKFQPMGVPRFAHTDYGPAIEGVITIVHEIYETKKGKKQKYDENFTIHLPWHFLRSFSVRAVNSAFFGPILGENLVRDLHPSNSPSSPETLVDIHELRKHIRISLHSRTFCWGWVSKEI